MFVLKIDFPLFLKHCFVFIAAVQNITNMAMEPVTIPTTITVKVTPPFFSGSKPNGHKK